MVAKGWWIGLVFLRVDFFFGDEKEYGWIFKVLLF
jgi:hypothetical protein